MNETESVAIEIVIHVDDLPDDIGWKLECEDQGLVKTTYVDRKPPRILEPGACGCEDPGVSFCNYDLPRGRGICERCSDIPDCDNDGLPQKGADDCHLWCSKERDASLYRYRNETNSGDNESELFLELPKYGVYSETFDIPEGSDCFLFVFQNHGWGTNCKLDSCYQVYHRGPSEGATGKDLIAQECGYWNLFTTIPISDSIEVPAMAIDFNVSSSASASLSPTYPCNRRNGAWSGFVGILPMMAMVFVFLLVAMIYFKTGYCGKNGGVRIMEAILEDDTPAATGPATGPATNALGHTVEERLETLEFIKEHLSREEFEQMKNEILAGDDVGTSRMRDIPAATEPATERVTEPATDASRPNRWLGPIATAKS